ncbi:EPM2A (laforin) interacting protein 1 [Dermatophagoides farinae]|uniref:EPM2A (Laforin) interacting protein 1 n=1 Tax=Dermatophagoides farinae TaxID=6954 RepID=A0A922I7G8_DERFA|nr:EPM2A (laforin) interacting protein 1 [Dermatophagoides farinae]
MNKITKKRRINDENREFNLKWTFDYFFINNNNKALCLICNEAITIFKEFNLRRHYDAKHKNKIKLILYKNHKKHNKTFLKNVRIKVQHWSKRPYICRNIKIEI